jgi:hypothetical protein
MGFGDLNAGSRSRRGVGQSGGAPAPAGLENRLKLGFGGLALAFCIMHDIGAADL